MSAPVTLRPRVAADLPVLVEILAEQQPCTRYPLRWPLPFPVEQFIVRDSEDRAWVAERDGQPVGHVMVGRVDDPDIAAAFSAATGATDLAMVSVLFVSAAVRGAGVGGLLLDAAVSWARQQRRQPVLDVVPIHDVAADVYRHRGWYEIGTIRPDWLPPGAPDVVLMVLPGDPAS